MFRFANPHEAAATFTIAAGQTATVTADITLIRTPFNDDTLDAEWGIEPAQGGPFTVFSPAPGAYEGPLGVDLDFELFRVGGGYLIDGTADPDVERGRVELWGYPPRSKKAVRLARVPVRSGGWAAAPLATGPARRVGAVRALLGRRAQLRQQRLDLRNLMRVR